MTPSNNILPDWIRRYVSVESNVKVDGTLTKNNAFGYLLTANCPLIFESYAIILHPFWINWKLKTLNESKCHISNRQVDEADFERVSWQQFFSIYERFFDLATAYQIQEELLEILRKDDASSYVWIPSEGSCESEELSFVLQQISNIYGDIIANYYFCLYMTKKWEQEYIYRGRLSEYPKLAFETDLRGNPTSIFPDERNWCIVSDYDLPFTYVGGTKKLIDSITNCKFEIFKIAPAFRKKIDSTST